MRSKRILGSVLCVQLAAFAGGCWAAQAGGAAPEPKLTGVLLPPAVEVSSPFAMDAPDSEREGRVAFLAQDRMPSQDREAVQNASAAISERAALRGFDLKQRDWSYQQIACPVFPDSILLLYTRNDGVGDVSEFSAVLSRTGNQPLHILPILRRGYSSFHTAPENAVTIAAFNTLRAQAQPGHKVDWLAAGLCYAALSGARVQLPQVQGQGASGVSLVANSLLQVDENGSASVHFFDVAKPQEVMSWDLAFDNRGKLIRVAVTPVPALQTRLIP